MPTKTKKEVKKQTTNAGLKKYAQPRNPTGKGGFTGADDPRRNNAGQRSAEVVAFGRSLRELLVTVGEEVTTLPDGRKISKIEGVVRAAYRQAIEGDASARSFIAERVEGKVTDKTELTGANGGAIEVDNVNRLTDDELNRKISELLIKRGTGVPIPLDAGTSKASE